MWWCAHEQNNLTTPPYTWNMCEVELGMTDRNGVPKPVLHEFKEFKQFLVKIEQENIVLPPAHEDGVCILTKGQDHWGIAYMSYILAKQAGVNLRFADGERELPDSNVYLMPSVRGHLVMARERYLKLIEKVKNGATLYISNDECILAEFNTLTGLTVENSRQTRRVLKATGAEVLETDNDGLPLFTKYKHGKGTVYYLDYPLETMLLNESGAFEKDKYKKYNEIFNRQYDSHILCLENKDIGVTQHFGERKSYVVLINYSGEAVTPVINFNKKYKHMRQIYGDIENIKPFGAVILEFEKKDS
jgi:endo-1,4-beta-mannosidase